MVAGPYAQTVPPLEVEEFLRSRAPVDVQETVAWLLANGYTLTGHEGGGEFGALFVFAGQAEARITVDRSQWFLDVAQAPGAKPWQYDLLIAASSGRPYGQRFPAVGTVGSWPSAPPLPRQLPDGVSWRQTLPGLLSWMQGPGVAEAVANAQRQRSALIWPRDPRESVTMLRTAPGTPHRAARGMCGRATGVATGVLPR